jgi:sigma-B regulation protein RsbU (phosphoserine phosphatase)
VKLKLQSLWRRAGKLEKAFALVLVLYLVLLAVWRDSGLETFAAFVTYVLGAWVALRLLRIGLRKLTWRLRNRLMVAYLFIAVLPILLILTLAVLGGYMLAGQVAVYMVRSELNRRVASLESAAQVLDASGDDSPDVVLRRTAEVYEKRFPGIAFVVEEKGKVRRWPDNAAVAAPEHLSLNSSGLAALGGRYYAWHYAAKNGAKCLVVAPLSRQYLSGMMPGLGDVYFLQPELTGRRAAIEITTTPDAEVHAGATKIGAEGGGQFRFTPAGGDALHAALPPPVNRFDVDVQWGSIIRAVDWAHPEKTQPAFLLVHTRLSSLLATILSQGGDELQGGIVVIFYAVAVAFLIVGIAGLAIGISMSRSITGAVHSLYAGTQRVMSGDFSHLIPVSGRDQLAELSSSFNSMTQNLERLLVVAKEKERMEAEIEIARGVQDQLYPKAPPVFEGLKVLGMCDPARTVSGDYYDYQLVDGRLAIAIGDVAGKGISAALLMATIQAAMRMELRASAEVAASMNGLRFSTARMVSELNQQLYATTSPEKFATFFFAIYDPATGVITYTNAGHLQPLLIRDGAPTRLDVNGTIVGAFPFSKYEESKLALQSGDLLVCYTDGITEPENEYGEMFGEERLIELVAKNAARDDSQIIESVMEAVRQWTGVPELSDDMTLLLARKR